MIRSATQRLGRFAGRALGSMRFQSPLKPTSGLSGPPANSPITPEPSNIWPIVRFFLAALILAGLVYFFRHR